MDVHTVRRGDIDNDEDDIPYSVLRPPKKQYNLPPLPDLRFEQSYLRSIETADTWWKVLFVTIKSQVAYDHPWKALMTHNADREDRYYYPWPKASCST